MDISIGKGTVTVHAPDHHLGLRTDAVFSPHQARMLASELANECKYGLAEQLRHAAETAEPQ